MSGVTGTVLELFMLAGSILLLATAVGLFIRVNGLRHERDRLLAEKDLIYNFVYDISEVFVEEDSVDSAPIVRRVLSCALKTARAGAGAVYLRNGDGRTLAAAAVSGIFPPLVGGADAELDTAFSKVRHVEALVRSQHAVDGEGLIGEVAATGQTTIVASGEDDPRVPTFKQDFLRVRSLVLVPMRFHHSVIGVLVVANPLHGGGFTAFDGDLLQTMADQAAVAVHYAQVSMALDEKRRMDYDLVTARNIQTALLPKEIPRVAGVDMAAFSVSAQQIGGDFYEFVQIDEHHVGIAIADVSGKGVTGGLVMSICRTVLRVTAPGCLSPTEVLRKVNRIVCEDISDDMFVSMLYMILDTRTLELAVARAGHVAPLVCPPPPAEAWEVSAPGIAVGLAGIELFDAELEDRTVKLSPDDCVIVYTDGVTEAQDAKRHEWGVLNLAKTVQLTASESGSAGTIARNVRQKLLQFVGDVPQYDDMTLVVVRVHGREDGRREAQRETRTKHGEKDGKPQI